MNNALIRNTSVSRGRRFDGYEELEQGRVDINRNNSVHGRIRAFSVRNKKDESHHYGLRVSSSYRRERAKQRQIYLKSYKLASVDTIRRRSMSLQKHNKLVTKVKKVVVSIVSLLRIGSASLIRSSCDCPRSVCASSPSRL
ncbi:hypothetical protein FNV43_RR13577 [Rhamnella rubrinervis]|uniref:Uncharacterized protein n=1 Tax=Rhamnella rubrinervis TaxID=2594499 RepID=A0A8K0MFE7_9ROSA|nr:hypothetical protein FNV43_RR13577 [Rhamnella rubrinervis]